MSTAAITRDDQITIPANIRKSLGIAAGDRIHFVLDESGRVVFLKATQKVIPLKDIIAGLISWSVSRL